MAIKQKQKKSELFRISLPIELMQEYKKMKKKGREYNIVFDIKEEITEILKKNIADFKKVIKDLNE